MSALGSIYIEWRTISCWSSERNIFRISKKEGCLNSRTKYGTRRWRLARNRTTVLHALCRSQQLNSLFEVARLRTGAAEKHPPQIIYFMLFGLGLGCSLLAAFGMAASAGHSWIHMLLFAGTLTVALYTVTDMEYPRLGLIRIESFDHFLADAYDQMR